jgi:hypothetical protein
LLPMSSTSLDASFVVIENDSSNVDTKRADSDKPIMEASNRCYMNRVLPLSCGEQQPVHSSQDFSYHPGSTYLYAHDWSEGLGSIKWS